MKIITFLLYSLVWTVVLYFITGIFIAADLLTIPEIAFTPFGIITVYAFFIIILSQFVVFGKNKE